jgi:hypothetical protein
MAKNLVSVPVMEPVTVMRLASVLVTEAVILMAMEFPIN